MICIKIFVVVYIICYLCDNPNFLTRNALTLSVISANLSLFFIYVKYYIRQMLFLSKHQSVTKNPFGEVYKIIFESLRLNRMTRDRFFSWFFFVNT